MSNSPLLWLLIAVSPSETFTIDVAYVGPKLAHCVICSLLAVDFLFLTGGGVRERERGVVLANVLPPTGHGLSAGVELHAIGPVDVQVTEERAVPAAEGVVGDGYRNGDVDANHPCGNFGLEALGGGAVIGEDRGAVAVSVALDQIEGVVESVNSNDAQHWSEDLIGVDPHVNGDLIEETRPEPIAFRRSLGLKVASVYGDLRSFRFAYSHVRSHAIAVLRGDQRAHLGVRVRAITDRESRHARSDPFDQLVTAAAHRH